jgi:hypothetical protein
VRELHILEGRLPFGQVRWANEALPVMRGFVNVNHLDLEALDWNTLDDAALSALKSFPSLTYLSIRACEFFNFHQLADTICSCSKVLNTLQCISPYWGPDKPATHPSPPSLKRLALSFRANVLIDWLLLHEHAFMDIHTFAVELGNPVDEIPNVSRFLEAIGPSLEHLLLRFDDGWNIGELILHRDLDLLPTVKRRHASIR